MLDKFKKFGDVIIIVISIIAATSGYWYFFSYDKIEIEYKEQLNTVKAKNIALQDDRSRLEDENRKLLSWLTETPKTIPYFNKKLKEKDTSIDSLKALLAHFNVPSAELTQKPPIVKKYRYSEKLKEAESFIDPLTNSTISIYNIQMSFKAMAKADYPDGFNLKKVKSNPIEIYPGYTWSNVVFKERQFKIVVQKIDPLLDEFVVEIIEL